MFCNIKIIYRPYYFYRAETAMVQWKPKGYMSMILQKLIENVCFVLWFSGLHWPIQLWLKDRIQGRDILLP
jgi:hypothetical protein